MSTRKTTTADRLAHGYGLVKRSIAYPIGLMLIVLFWYLGNRVFKLDPGLVNLLTFLSVEASLATSLMQRDQAKQEEIMMVMLKSIKHTLEAIKGEQ